MKKKTNKQTSAPLKIGPPDWLSLNDACRRTRDRVGSCILAARDVYDWLSNAQLSSAIRLLNYPNLGQRTSFDAANAAETCALLDTKFWREVCLFGVTAADGTENYRVRYRDNSVFGGEAYFFVKAAEFERLNSASTSDPVPPIDMPPLRRRGPVLKHDWHAIDGEIARRCHDKSGRIAVPKSESKLADDVLQWCEDTNRPQPSESEMREAVKAICAALRKI